MPARSDEQRRWWFLLLAVAVIPVHLSPATSLGVDAAGSASGTACDASGSGSGVTCPTPPPLSHLQTILTWDCMGRVRVFPDNPLMNINLDIPLLPRMFQAAYSGMKEYIKGHCDPDNVSDTDFSKRYHPLQGMLYGNRMYSSTDIDPIPCLDDLGSFTRDFPKLYRALAGKSSFEMPASCKYDVWDKVKNPLAPDDEKDPKCSFIHEVMEIGAQLQVVVKKCDNHKDFFQISVGCAGTGCNLMMPCKTDYDCNAKDHLVCADPFNWRDPKIKGSTPKFEEKDVYDLFRTWFKIYQADYDSKESEDFYPKKILKTFIEKFAKYIVGSPEATGGSTCSGSDDACKICLPAHTNAFETSLSDFPGRWREVSEEYPKSRYKYGTDGCALSPERLVSNASILRGDDKLVSLPSILAPVYPLDAMGGAKYPNHKRFFDTESPLVQGAEVYFKGTKQMIGGANCDSHTACGTGMCISDDIAYCELAQNECDRHGLCELNPNQECVPIHQKPVSQFTCACFALDRFSTTSDSAQFVYGASCAESQYIGTIDASDLLDSFYSETIHKWRSRYDPFIYWDGVTAADGLDPFTERDHWAKWPVMQASLGETHIASFQCEGVLHMFMGTPSHMRLYAPMVNDLAQFWSETVFGAWKQRDRRQILGNNPRKFLLSQAIFRPEPWLYAKVWDRDHNYQAEIPQDFDTITRAVFNRTDKTYTEEFDMWNFYHLAKISPNFTLTDWFEKGSLSVAYTGMTGARVDDNGNTVAAAYVFPQGTQWNLRMEECPSHPMGLVSLQASCKGNACDNILLRTTCAKDGECPQQIKCAAALDTVYQDDLPSQVLWGVARTPMVSSTGGDDVFTKDSLCPVLEVPGVRGSTSREKGVAVKKLTSLMWTAYKYADCDKRVAAECWGHCNWQVQPDGTFLCQYLGGETPDPALTGSGEPLMMCAPDVHPFMADTLYDAIVTKKQFTTAVGRVNTDPQKDPKEVPLYNRSANLYDVLRLYVREKQEPTLVFSIVHHTDDLPRATFLDTESVYPPVLVDNEPAFGTSFFVVIIAMGSIVLASACLVWCKYIRTTKAERERLSRLRGLSFAFKQDTKLYGRDLMIPAMYRKWLPREGTKYAELEPPKDLTLPEDDPPEDEAEGILHMNRTVGNPSAQANGSSSKVAEAAGSAESAVLAREGSDPAGSSSQDVLQSVQIAPTAAPPAVQLKQASAAGSDTGVASPGAQSSMAFPSANSRRAASGELLEVEEVSVIGAVSSVAVPVPASGSRRRSRQPASQHTDDDYRQMIPVSPASLALPSPAGTPGDIPRNDWAAALGTQAGRHVRSSVSIPADGARRPSGSGRAPSTSAQHPLHSSFANDDV